MPEVESDGAARPVHSHGAKDSQNNIKVVVDMGDKGTMEIPLTGKLVVDLQQNSGAASTVNSVVVKDLQNNVKLVVDLGDKGTMEVPLTGELVGDDEDPDQMRGWMMTVATLFVTLAYEAVMQPPSWMPDGDWLEVERNSYKKHYGTTTAMPAPSPSPPAITVHQARLAHAYMYMNTFTFGTALALVVILVLMAKKPPPSHTKVVKYFVVALACSVASTFVLGASDEPSILKLVSAYTVLNTVATAWYVAGVGKRWWPFSAKKREAPHAKRKFSSTAECM